MMFPIKFLKKILVVFKESVNVILCSINANRKDDAGRKNGKKCYLNAAKRKKIAVKQNSNNGLAIPKRMENDFSDFEDLTLPSYEMASFEELNAVSVRNQTEALQIFFEGGKTELITDNEFDRVGVPKEHLKKKHLSLFHSHTEISPFSRNDMAFLVYENIDRIGIVTSNKDIFIIELGEGYRPSSKDEFDILYQEKYNEIGMEIIDGKYGDMSHEENSYFLIRETMFQIARHYGWTIKGGKLHE